MVNDGKTAAISPRQGGVEEDGKGKAVDRGTRDTGPIWPRSAAGLEDE